MNRFCRQPLPADPLFESFRAPPVVIAMICAACVLGRLSADIRAEPTAPAHSPAAPHEGDGAVPSVLIEQLKHASPARRCEALLRLSELQSLPESLQSQIWPLLADSDPLVRAQAANCVWHAGNRGDAATATLIGLLDPRQPQVCAVASFLLGEIGEAARDSLPALRARMLEIDPLLRLHAAEAIVKIDPGDTEAHLELTRALQDSSPDVRYFAACALLSAGGRHHDAVRSALLETLSDDDLRVASAAALSLDCCSADEPPATIAPSNADATTSPALSRLTANLADPNAAVRRRAAEQLADCRIPVEQAAIALRERLDDDDPLVRAYSAYALWRANREVEAVLPTLIHLLGTVRPNATTIAISVVAQIGPAAADALPTLYDLMENGDPMVRLHVAMVISHIDPRGRESIGVLAEAARSNDSDLRYLGTLSMGHVSRPLRKLAERELTRALGDRNLRVRSAAALALSHLEAASTLAQEERDPVVSAPENPVQGAETAHADFTALEDAETIPVIDEQPAPESASPGGRLKDEFDVDEATVEERKMIGELRARITPSEGALPADHAAPLFAMEGVHHHGLGMARGWNGSTFAWANTGLCFRPLYFQDINLERVGYHYGCAQTLVSTLKFAADAALLPYKVVAENPHECVYTLGYDRAGNCVPYRYYRMPWRTDAAMVLGGVAVGLIFLAPP